MISRILLAAVCAGLLAGLLITPVQYLRVVPLIHQAERYEAGDAHPHEHASLVGAAHAAPSAEAAPVLLAHAPAGAAATPKDDASLLGQRWLGTLLANLVTGAGFALLLAAAGVILGLPITAATGAWWGLAGFAVMSFAPALGLPPELPAMPAANLGARQAWWAFTVTLSAAGIYALVLRREPWAKAIGVFALALPHLWGAPHPLDLSSPVPPTLAAEFAVLSLATAGFFWLSIGVLLGAALDRSGARVS